MKTANQQSMIRKSAQKSLFKRLFPFLLAGFLVLAVLFLPSFHLQSIELPDQLRTLTQEQLRSASGLLPGQHLFCELGGSIRLLTALRYGPVEERIKSHFPTVRDVAVTLDFPGAIRIFLEERVEVAWLTIPDGCVMIDKEGVALKICKEPPDGIPVIEGLQVRSMILGRPLEVDQTESLSRAISLLGSIIEADKDPRPKTNLLAQIKGIRPISGRTLYLTLIIPETGEEMTVLAEIRSGQTEDMLWLRFALDQSVLAGRGKGILDLTGDRRTFVPDS